jgi:glycosyltransferase involved in cell wall biosynthesis
MVAEALDMRLVVAGPGATEWGDGYVKFPEGEARCPGLEYVGSVGSEERAKLMGGAAATLMPTIYVEPFGGVAVESMMCGTPVVTTDFGAFTETVVEGVSGYRFQTLQEAVDRTVAAMELDRQAVRQHAVDHYSLDAVEPLYDRWFTNLDGLWGEGWTALRDREMVA